MGLSLESVRAKECTIGIVGLGYVGFPLAMAFAGVGVKVLGFDVDRGKIHMINEGECYFNHLDSCQVADLVSKGVLAATHDFRRIEECDAIIICVPTPLDAHLEPDLKYIVETCKMITPYLKADALVALESTTYPGTTRDVVQPLLEHNGRRKLGEDLYLCYSPEREDPGNASYGTRNIPKLVGSDDPDSLSLAVVLYELALDTVVPVSSAAVAESAKLFENIFRSVNIALVNEMKIILDKMDINVWEVIEAAGTKPFGFMPFWPGPGLGGHCIPIDPFYLTWKAKEYGVNTRFIELAGEINRSMPNWVVAKVQDCLNDHGKPVKGSRILIFGVAYKADIDDIRESPSLELIKLLEAKGAIVDYHDPYVAMIGPTREYSELADRQSQEVTGDYDCFLIATKHSCFDPERILSYSVPVVDTRNLIPKRDHVFSA
ncbi:UDP-N-acetyl-D-glucosamine 6-dehydrogenase [Chlamydiales bacterium SCGC AG-110-P3]|nr:UDP-N-acetyl-D-glucosamine 6-dehydrogenase [Chlamydiales bacterium SCGC AG-110-P3]